MLKIWAYKLRAYKKKQYVVDRTSITFKIISYLLLYPIFWESESLINQKGFAQKTVAYKKKVYC